MARTRPVEGDNSSPVEETPLKPTTDSTPDPVLQVLQQLANQQAMLMDVMSRMAVGGQSTDQKLLADAMDRMAKATEAAATLQANATERVALETKKAHRPSNEVVPMVSEFDRRGRLVPGYKKPLLRCTMMIPWLAENESCTREEVELLNLLQPGQYRIKRIDRSFVTIDVKVSYKSDEITPSRLIIEHETAFNNDYFRLMPPLSDWLRYVLSQHHGTVEHETARLAADAVLTDEEEAELIRVGDLTTSYSPAEQLAL